MQADDQGWPLSPAVAHVIFTPSWVFAYWMRGSIVGNLTQYLQIEAKLGSSPLLTKQMVTNSGRREAAEVAAPIIRC